VNASRRIVHRVTVGTSEDMEATQAADATYQTSPTEREHGRPRQRGDSLGRYLVIEKLGAGAMGVVYAAYDHELDRRVAIKLWHTDQGASTTADVARTRLLREAQALARLAHPNVVGVHDVGTVDGEVFVAMEYVDGETLEAWLTRTRPRWPQVLATFLAAGHGLAAAHAAGLVHRDFKPENVMVGRDARVRVMDFGLARASGAGGELPTREDSPLDLELTRTGGLLGTPAYMPSEQFHGRLVDARSDQFAFCVALWEALYGERPFAATSLSELIARVDAGEVSPIPRGAAAPAWLRRVLLRGLRPDPKDRYEDMRVLLAALARDPRTLRRRLALAGLGAALLAGLALATRSDGSVCEGGPERWASAWSPARAAAVTDALVATGRPHAADTATRVREGLDAYGAALVAMHHDACAATRLRGEQSDALLDLRMTCLGERLIEVDALARHLAVADSEAADLAVSAVAALTPVAACGDVAALTAAVPPPSDPAARAQVDAARVRLAEATAMHRLGRYKEGLPIARTLVTEAREIGHAPLIAEALLTLASFEINAADPNTAGASLLAAISEAARAGDRELHARAWVALTRHTAGALRRPDEAMHWATAMAAAIDLAHPGPDLRASALAARGEALISKGDYTQARAAFEAALALLPVTDGGDELRRAAVMQRLGSVLQHLALPDEARAMYTSGLEAVERTLGPEHPRVAGGLTSLANLARDAGDYATARALTERALALREAAHGPEHQLVAQLHFNLAFIAQLRGDLPAARAGAERALQIFERSLGAAHPDLSYPLNFLGVLAQGDGRLDEAEALLRRALAIDEAAVGVDNPELGSQLCNLGNVALARGHLDEAKHHFGRALILWEKAYGHDHPELSHPLIGLAEAAHASKARTEALALAERALALTEGRTDAPIQRARAMLAVANYLHTLGKDPARARRLAATATLDLPAGSESDAIAAQAAALRAELGA
jgi:tetratricopeptide (TPR) repeat protein/predicted Ser/Thr protein kinase